MEATPSVDAATLWARITEVYQTATSTGAAQSIKATRNIIYDSDLDIHFVVYVADSLNKKPKAPQRTECVCIPAVTVILLPHTACIRLESRLTSYIRTICAMLSQSCHL